MKVINDVEQLSTFEFEIIAECSQTRARCGRFKTPHGLVYTPQFMPVGTAATVKGITVAQLSATKAQIVLANTFHLHLQPGEDVIAGVGGLHNFMGWDGPMLTDSGGFQVFSLGNINSISDKGVVFHSPRDGSRVELTPEKATQIQMALGADIAMAFDQCPPPSATEEDMRLACERTHRWLERCISTHNNKNQALFGIVQGGCFLDLRQKSVQTVADLGLYGNAIGGVSVGEPVHEIHRIIRQVTPLLPKEKPRYLMGIGTLPEMKIAVASGIDLFDCVLPTRLGRHGTALVKGDRWNLRNARFRQDYAPLDENCPCPACKHLSRAYLHHLVHSDELLGVTLLSLHNLTVLIRFTTAMGEAIRDGCFSEDFAPWANDSPAAHTW
uniref:Queuine tRNA-ribosyltransferase catalytic subunit 1 n=1 Tax=Paulinella longichromatophora TaxID=1708747 RepID=A0A2H4ZPM6_9EUKA|nr:Queuine tRNA-ribosyltransferase [Paulinella longichromatophora]